MKQGIVHIFVGAPGTGKTTLIHETIKKLSGAGLKYYVNDYNSEYNSVFVEPKKFLQSMQRVENCAIVFEEATIYFSHQRNDEQIRNILGGKRHKHLYIIFVFHALEQIPSYILVFANYITIFKTEDYHVKVKKMKAKIYECFQEVSKNRNPHYNKTIKLN